MRSTLSISLPPELSRMVAEKVASGRYSSASEVIRAGLRLLERDEPPALSAGNGNGANGAYDDPRASGGGGQNGFGGQK